MPDLRVDSNTSLGRFLRKNKTQQWRIPILILRDGVKVFRGSTGIPLKDEHTRVSAGDTVRLVTPIPKPCQQALQDEANKNSRDYALVPGTTTYDVSMGKLMESRPATIRINDPLLNDLTGFLRALQDNPLITNPIRNLIVASHANPQGLLFFSIGMLSARIITYEDLEAAVKSKSIVLNDALFLPRPTDASGTVIPVQFLFRGCRIGSQPAFMKKLKEALGNKIPVVAPIHFHLVDQFSSPAGYVEYMGYNFMVKSSIQLKKRGAVVNAFDKGGFSRIDTKPVPTKLWGLWIPANPNLPGDNKYGNTAVIPINKRRGSADRTFRYRSRQLLDKPGSFALLKDTGKKKDRKDALKQELLQIDLYKNTHPFPEYIRFGYKTIDEFMDGWDWGFTYDKKSKTLFYNGTRHEYTLIQPIAEIKTDELVLNYYPTPKSKGKVLELLNVTDTRFFATF